MLNSTLVRSFLALAILIGILAAACDPSADATYTAAPRSTATTSAQLTATTAGAQPTATTAAQATATRPATGGTEIARNIPVLITPPPNPNATSGGTVRIGHRADASDWSPWEGAAAEPGWSRATALTLLEYNAFEGWGNETILPKVAIDWWTDASGERWTFKLQPGIKYSDGKEVTCADAAFMVNTIRNATDATGDELRRSPRSGYLQRVTDASCADDYTLIVDTSGPLASLAGSLALGYFQVKQKDYFEGNLERFLDDFGPENGPFLFDDYFPSEKLTYVRNPDYFFQPYPYVDKLERINLGSDGAQEAALRTGNLELGATTRGNRPILVEEGFLDHTGIIPLHGSYWVQANFTREPWNDPRFSHILKYTIDTDKAIATGADGFGYNGAIFSSPSDYGGSKWALTLDEWDAIGPCHGPTVNTPWSPGATETMEMRQEIARGLMTEMGFGPDNPARPFTYVWTPTGVSLMWPSVLDDLEKVWIEPDWEPMETARAYDKNYASEFDINIWSYSVARADADTWLFEHFISTSDRNYGKYTNPEIDALIEIQSQTLDPKERLDLVHEISTILLQDNAKVLVRHYATQEFWAPWLKDYAQGIGTTGGTYYSYERIWIDQSRLDQRK